MPLSSQRKRSLCFCALNPTRVQLSVHRRVWTHGHTSRPCFSAQVFQWYSFGSDSSPLQNKLSSVFSHCSSSVIRTSVCHHRHQHTLQHHHTSTHSPAKTNTARHKVCVCIDILIKALYVKLALVKHSVCQHNMMCHSADNQN